MPNPSSPLRRQSHTRFSLPPIALALASAAFALPGCQVSTQADASRRAASFRNGGYSTGYGGGSATTSAGESYSYSGDGAGSYTSSSGGYGGGSYSTSGETLGGSTSGWPGGSTGGAYSGSTSGGTYSTSGGTYSTSGGTYSTSGGTYSTGGGESMSDSSSTGGFGDSYTYSTSGVGSDSLTATTTDTTLATSGSTGGDIWYGIPSGTFLTGMQSDAYESDECSVPAEFGEDLVSVCKDLETLEYPNHTTCTDSPVWSSQDCNEWCGSVGKGDGACEAVPDGPDRCACQRRTDVGIPPNVAGCVAEFAASDQSCGGDAVEYHLATCGEATNMGRTVPDTVNDKRLVNAVCSDDGITTPAVNCDDWCVANAADPLKAGFGYCEVVDSDDCGGEPAARCACSPPEYAVSTLPGGAACSQIFDHPDTCDNQEEAWDTTKSSCSVGGEAVITLVTQACSTQEPEVETRNCSDYCPDHLKGVCAGGKDITCPNGDETQVANCVCVPK